MTSEFPPGFQARLDQETSAVDEYVDKLIADAKKELDAGHDKQMVWALVAGSPMATMIISPMHAASVAIYLAAAVYRLAMIERETVGRQRTDDGLGVDRGTEEDQS